MRPADLHCKKCYKKVFKLRTNFINGSFSLQEGTKNSWNDKHTSKYSIYRFPSLNFFKRYYLRVLTQTHLLRDFTERNKNGYKHRDLLEWGTKWGCSHKSSLWLRVTISWYVPLFWIRLTLHWLTAMFKKLTEALLHIQCNR